MAKRRELPYIWATWLPRLLVGESSCEWAVWFRAHYQDRTKVPSNFNQTEWLLNHTALLNQCREHWKEKGFDVTVEAQNSFKLCGRSATLAGKPDLIAHRDGEAVIVDAKTGNPNASHIVQVMVYMYAMAKVSERYRNVTLSGQVAYGDHTVQVPANAIDDEFEKKLVALVLRLASDTPSRKVPSAQECGFCDISAVDCPERVEESQSEEAATDDF